MLDRVMDGGRPDRVTRGAVAAGLAWAEPEAPARVAVIREATGCQGHQGHESEADRAVFHRTEPPLLGWQGQSPRPIRRRLVDSVPVFRAGHVPPLVAALPRPTRNGSCANAPGGSNRVQRDSELSWRNWEELAQPAKPAGLARQERLIGA